MSDNAAIDLSMLARRQRRTLTEIGSMRDDFAVLAGVAMRRHGTRGSLLNEVHSRHGRLADREREPDAST